MFELSNREKMIYDAMMRDKDAFWSVSQIADLIWKPKEGNGTRPHTWRQSILWTMRQLRTKTYVLKDLRIVKVSKSRGRGNKGVFGIAATARRNGMDFE